MKTKNIKRKNKAILTMGLPGAGKSYILETRYQKELHQSVVIDPDLEKQSHPDYDPSKPELIHEWSKEKAKAKLLKAIAEKKNLIIDGTGTNLEKMIKYIVDLQGNGYDVTLVYVKVSLKTSMKRNKLRERVVPESIIREKAEYVATSYETLSQIVDKIEVHNNE